MSLPSPRVPPPPLTAPPRPTSLLFLAAIIPSHIHGFYLSCTYFHRRRKVRRGRWPGGPKPLIYSDNVLCGGARWDEAQRLRRLEQGGGPDEKVELRKQRRASRRESRRVTRRPGGYGESRQASYASVAGGGGGGGYGGLRYGLGDGDAAGWNASNGVVGPGYGPGFGPDGRAYRGVMRRARTAC